MISSEFTESFYKYFIDNYIIIDLFSNGQMNRKMIQEVSYRYSSK